MYTHAFSVKIHTFFASEIFSNLSLKAPRAILSCHVWGTACYIPFTCQNRTERKHAAQTCTVVCVCVSFFNKHTPEKRERGALKGGGVLKGLIL